MLKQTDKTNMAVIISLVIILILTAVRIIFTILHNSFYIDENARAVLVQTILDEGYPYNYPRFGIFFILTDASYCSVTFYGFAVLWAAVFGSSVMSLRIFMSLLTVCSIVFLGRGISYWYKNDRLVFLCSVIVGLLIPWNFLQGMLFWDTTFAPIYIIIAFWAFSRLANSAEPINKSDKIKHIITSIIMPLALIAAAYTYQPIGFLAVSLYLFFCDHLYQHKIISTKQIYIILLISAAASLPFVIALFNWPEFTGRAGYITITAYDGSFKDKIRVFVRNWDRLLSMDFLFFTGDFNKRHATGSIGGMLGIGTIIPIITTIHFYIKHNLNKNELLLCKLSVTGILFSLFGAALSIEGMPHSLRSNGAWIFVVILVSIGYIKLFQARSRPVYKRIFILSIFISIIFTVVYLRHFYCVYLPEVSNYFFIL